MFWWAKPTLLLRLRFRKLERLVPDLTMRSITIVYLQSQDGQRRGIDSPSAHLPPLTAGVPAPPLAAFVSLQTDDRVANHVVPAIPILPSGLEHPQSAIVPEIVVGSCFVGRTSLPRFLGQIGQISGRLADQWRVRSAEKELSSDHAHAGRGVGLRLTVLISGPPVLARGTLTALGVTNADFFTFEVRQTGVAGTRVNVTQQKLAKANLQQTGTPGRLFVIDEVGAASPAEPSDTDLITLDFLCIGDDARVPVLT